MRTTRFPPPLWGRDRERGGDKAPSAKLVLCTNSGTTAGCTCCTLRTQQMQRVLYPSPCPSPTRPTRGEGTLWRCSAQRQASIRVHAHTWVQLATCPRDANDKHSGRNNRHAAALGRNTTRRAALADGLCRRVRVHRAEPLRD